MKNTKGVSKEKKEVGVKKTKEVAKETKEVMKKTTDGVVRKENDKHFIKERPKLPPSTIKEVESKNEDSQPPSPPRRKLPQRALRVNYSELDVPDDDHFLCE